MFERAYAAAPHTSFALTSLLIGRPAVAMAHVGHLDGHPTLADLLHAHGYATAAFIPPAVFFVEPERFRAYERRQLGFRHLDMQALAEDQSAPVQTRQVVDYLDRYRPARFAAWVHYFAPHEPYVTHAESGVAPFGHRAVDRYDEEIRWVDREIGRLIKEVRIRYPRTIIVVTADHGEEFGEHGGAYHGTTLFDEQIRVPLVIHAPGVPHRRVSAPVGAVDVLPTLLALLDVSPPTDLPGIDLGPWLDATKPAIASPLAVAENGTALRMIVGEGHKLICNISWPDCILFDLAKDAAERRDIIASRPEVAGRLKRELAAWQAAVARGPARPSVSGVQLPLDVVLARARLRDPTAAPELIALLASHDLVPSQRRAAARHLAFVAGTRHRKAVRELAASETQPGVLLWLQTVLTVLGDRDSASKLEASLRSNASTPVDNDLLVHGTLALASIRVALDVDLLSRALALTDDVETRCNIFRALGRSRDRALAARLLIADYDTIRTRVCSARALAALAHPETFAFVVDRLPMEPYATVQLHLIEALRRMGDLRAVPALAALGTATQEPQVRAAAERAVATLRTERRSPASVRLRARKARHRIEAG